MRFAQKIGYLSVTALSVTMRSATTLSAAVLSATMLLGTLASQTALAQDADERWNTINQYCTECHDLEGFAGGIAFEMLSPATIVKDAEIWEKVIRKLRGGMMPPPGQERPHSAETTALISWLETTIDTAATGKSHVGSVALHRLNRAEYETAVKDLLGIEFDSTFLLPKDDVSDGFDNVANVLQVSPSFIDQYLNAARLLSTQAIGDNTLRQTIVQLNNKPGVDQGNYIPGLPLGSRGGVLAEHVFPADGEYSFNFNVSARNDENQHRVIVLLDGEQVYETTIGGAEESRMADQGGVAASREVQSRFRDVRLPVSAGKHQIGVAFISVSSFAEPEELLYSHTPAGRGGPSAGGIQVTGPFNATALGATPSRERIFICYPNAVSEEAACAEQIITQLATSAFRRPATAEDLAGPMNFYRAAREREDFEAGIQNALMMVLASPSFLYRSELAPAGTEAGEPFALSGLELASRLSFFLWSSVPDAELQQLGASGALLDDAVLEQQVDRMLADPRAESLVSNFAFQWLDVNKIDDIDPDPSLFPSYNQALAEAFREEMRLFVGSIFLQDRPVPELLSADYTFLNERLAKHYGVASVRGNSFRKVSLADENRWGLFGKGSILLATSYPNRTAPVLRGAWILERITGTPPNAPPPNVEALKETGANGEALTVRDLMVQHRADPSCNGCHGVMDPLGLALENFDAIGNWQTFDRFARADIDASGELPDGTPLNSPADLRRALLRTPEQFVQTLTEKLLTFALGRSVEYQDMPRVREIVSASAADDYRFSALIKGIVTSAQFRMNEINDTSGEVESGQVAASN